MLTGQEEAEAVSRLNLGTSTDILNNTSDSPLSKLLKDLMQGFIDELIKSMNKYDVSASRRLQQSLKPTAPIIEGSSLSVGVSVGEQQYYWKFINKGVNGTEVNYGAPNWGSVQAPKNDYHSSMLTWIRDRGITSDSGDYDSLAYAMINSIRKKGKAPRPFFDDVVNDPKLIELLRKPIEKLIGRAIVVKIVEPWQ